MKLMPELLKKRKTDSLPYPFHRVKVEVQIVVAGQDARKYLSANVQMSQVSPAISRAYGAFAPIINRTFIACPLRVSYVQSSKTSEQLPVSRIACRHYTIEHIY